MGNAMTTSPTLGELFSDEAGADAGLRVSGLAFDSRKVRPGDVFVAVPGARVDGAVFALAAAKAGASAIVGEGPRPADLPGGVVYRQVSDPRRSLALAAARIHPHQPGTVVAVTGTSGKSSVADFVRQIDAVQGRSSASVGTLGVVTSRGALYGSLTTPDPISLHATLDRLAGEGITHLAMEASSHGIDQRRLDGVRLSAVAFTNLGRDHLDYHATVRDYLAAKLRLFETLAPPGIPAVVNLDGAEAPAFADAARRRGLRLFTVGRDGADLRLLDVRADRFAQRLRIAADGREIETTLPMAGLFQVENALVAAGLAIATGSPVEPVLAALPHLVGVPGRMERVGEVNGALCLVDYAHKPEALARVLDALRPFATGRLVCVFGCGGDRDRGKRAIMGGIAAAQADVVIVTDDNPRTEEPAAIRAEILAAAPSAREIGDREEAIRTAVRGLRAGDVLVVAGKGHETGQIVGERTLPFSDHDAIRAAIAEIEG
jgi:UDP-N-acetylmuramoyl-L-alanyl-D-glutamate--2,6-diaminopimelate ligase